MHTCLGPTLGSSLAGLDIPLILAVDEEKLIIMSMVLGSGMLWYIIHSIKKIVEIKAKEQTKREVAAYLAEGSIKAEDAAVLLAGGSDDAERKIADAVAWGTIKPEKAEALLRTLRSDRVKQHAGPSA